MGLPVIITLHMPMQERLTTCNFSDGTPVQQ